MTTTVLRPDGSDTIVNWTGTYADLDEEHSSPSDIGDGNLMETSTHGAMVYLDFEDFPYSRQSISAVKIYVRAEQTAGSSDIGAYMRTDSGDSWGTGKAVCGANGSAEAWVDGTWSGLSLTAEQMDSLQIKISFSIYDGTPTGKVDVVYVAITHTADPITESDMIKGVITQRQRNFAVAEFTLAEDTEVGFDSQVQITGNYTIGGSTSSEIIFDGLLTDYTYDAQKKCQATSKQDEIARIKPSGYYQGYTGVWLSEMINDHADYINFDSADYGGTWTSYWDAPYNFSAMAGETGEDIDFVSSESGTSCEIHSELDDGQAESGSVHKNCLKFTLDATTDHIINDFSTGQSTGTIEYWFATDDVSEMLLMKVGEDSVGTGKMACILLVDTDEKLYYYDNTSKTVLYNTALNDGEWYRVKIIWNGDDTWDAYLYDHDCSTTLASVTGKGTYNDGLTPNAFYIGASTSAVSHIVYLDAIGYDWDQGYTVGDNNDEIVYNLPIGGELSVKPAAASQTLQQYLNEGCILEKDTWALTPEGDVRMHDGTEDSGASYTTDGAEYWNCSGSIQCKRPNKAIVKGMPPLVGSYEDTTRSTKAGTIVLKDFVPSINTQTALDTYAQALLETNENPPLIVKVSLRDSTQGFIQPGELLTVEASKWLWNDAGDYVTAGTYTIHEIRYHIKDGAYDYTEFELHSVLQFVEKDVPLDEDIQDQNMAGLDSGVSGTSVSGGSGGITSVVQDGSPELGGNLDLNNHGLIEDSAVDTTFRFKQKLILQTDDDDSDYLQFGTSSNVPEIDIIGATELVIKAAGTEVVGINSSGMILGNTDARITEFDTDTSLAGGDTKVPTDAAAKAYADTKATDAEAHAYVEANALTLTAELTMSGANIVMAGAETVDGKDVSGLCTTAEAVQAVEDTGLVLSSTKVITSADEDIQFTFGRAHIGTDGSQNDQAIFSHRDMANATDFALKQDELGNTLVNTKAAREMFFCVNDTEVGAINASGLILGNANARVTTILDEDAMGSDSATALATQQSIKAYADLHCTTAEAVQAVEDTGLVLTTDKTISFDAVQADTKYSGLCIDIDTTGCNTYDAVYVDGTDSVAPADADDFTKMPVIGIVVAAGKVLVHGVVCDDDLIKCTTVGDVIYMSTTLREVTADDTMPAGSGNIVQVVGICIGDHVLYVQPSLDWVEVA